MVETCDCGGRTGGEALTERLGGVVDQDFEGGVGGEAETLRATVATVDEDDRTVREERAFDHAASFGHRVHLPCCIC